MGRAFFDLFDQVYIINLKHRDDRRREITQELARFGVEVDGEGIAFFEAVKPDSSGAFRSIGARGCFASHLEVLRAARAAGKDRVLVLEDDAHFGKRFRSNGAAVTDALRSSDWDMFYGGYWSRTRFGETGAVVPVPPEVGLMTSHAVAFRNGAISAAVPYLEAMLAREAGSPEGGPMDVDGAYCWLRRNHPRLRTLAASPQIITQRSSISDITQKTGWRAKSRLVRLARRIKNDFGS